MNRNEIENKIAKIVSDEFGDCTITMKDVVKSNGISYRGMIVKFDDSNAAPTLYIDQYLKAIEEGKATVEETAEHAVRTIRQNRVGNIDFGTMDWEEQIKKTVKFELVNKSRNQELLETVIHRDVLDDLALIYKFIPSIMPEGTITINEQLLEKIELTEEEIYQMAVKNVDSEEVYLKSMASIMNERVGLDVVPEEANIYVLSNKEMSAGARMMMRKDVLRQIAEKVGGDLYIIPSSRHEVIVMPLIDGPEHLKQMIYEVNRSELLPEDYLSDTLYRYIKEQDEIVA